MHEMSVAHGLLSILQAQAEVHGIARISRVRVRIGRLRGLDARQLRLAFEALAEGSLAAGAALDVEEIAAQARCRACGAVWQAVDFRFDCPELRGRRRGDSRRPRTLCRILRRRASRTGLVRTGALPVGQPTETATEEAR